MNAQYQGVNDKYQPNNDKYQANNDKYQGVNDKYQDNEYEDNTVILQKTEYSSLYFITHLILSFFAIYLSWKCSKSTFNLLHFIAALLCPHLYIIWALAIHGGCGIFECR